VAAVHQGSAATNPTYVKVNGVWRSVYRAVDQHGQVVDVLVSARRDAAAARRFFRRAIATLKVTPVEVVTDAVAVLYCSNTGLCRLTCGFCAMRVGLWEAG
jgi:transposase-like protein